MSRAVWTSLILLAGCGGGGGGSPDPAPPVLPRFTERETATLISVATAMEAPDAPDDWAPSGHAVWTGTALIDVEDPDPDAAPWRIAGDWRVVHDFEAGWSGTILGLGDESGQAVAGRLDMGGATLSPPGSGAPRLAFTLTGTIGPDADPFDGAGSASVRGDGEWLLGDAWGTTGGGRDANIVLVARRDG